MCKVSKNRSKNRLFVLYNFSNRVCWNRGVGSSERASKAFELSRFKNLLVSLIIIVNDPLFVKEFSTKTENLGLNF